MLSVFDLLALNDFVADLPAGWLQRLAVAGRPVFHGVGHRLCREDAHADRFWLISSGAVAIDFYVPGRGDITVDRARPGAPVGWSWMRPPFRWQFGAVVADDVHAVEFDAARVRALIAEDADLGRELTGRMLDVVSHRLQAARHRLIELYAYPEAPAC
ncbi:Crp/Fnr family transcriptional regulator [Actinoplanes sp. NPDC048988]|uniref:Crp/Fnr family transcriptional regulator n=1 Tax=Actinoplanes sp. NPDC048988 TaxID=3363901 RepID=UPI0037190803